MDDHNEDEENQPNVLGDEATYSDSDDDMEVNRSDDKNTVDKLDSELVDSDVNVEATELTCSDDADLSDESDLIGDLTSDAESNVDQHEINDSVVDSEEETFALEVKDAKDDSSDEKDEVDEAEKDEVDEAEKDEVDEADQDEVDEADRENLTKNAPDADDADGNDAEDDINGDDYQNSDDEEKSTNNASSENVTGEITPSNDVEDHENKSVTSADESEAIDTKASDTKTLANGELSSTSQNEEHDARAKNVRRLPTLSKYESDAEEDTGERADGSTQPEAAEPANGFNFIGFDPDITERTLQIFYILQQNYQDLLSQLENASPKYEDDLAMEVDTEQSSQLADTVPEPAMCIDSDMASGDVSLDNQTEEQIAANKRVKKKRKFFDDFDNNELDPPKRLKEQLDKPPNVDVSMGENKENFINSEKLPEEKELTEVAPASPVSVVSSTPNPPSRPKSKPKVDISNPLFKEPFKYGWRREVVYRYISEDGQKKSADVSYFTPQGKKLRSTKQISDSLPKDGTLSIRNFTFSKELVFSNRECDLERTRFTKKMEAELLENESANVSGDLMLNRRLGIDPASTHTPVTSASASMPDAGDDLSKNPTTAAVFPATLTPAPSSSKKKDPQKSKSNAKTPGSDAVSKSKSSSKKGNKNMADPDAEESTNNMTPKLMMPKILLRAPNMANSNTASSKVTSGGKPSSMKIKIGGPPSKQSGQKSVKKPPSSSKSSKGSKSQKRTDKSIAPDLVSGSISADHSSHAKSARGTQTCSISCPSALGTIPTLQCTICLCLYHFQCCGMDADQPVGGYVCKPCQLCEMKKENIHPAFKAMYGMGHSPRTMYSTMSDHYDSLTLSSSSANFPATKIVDGVTTWLPSSSNIHLKTMYGGGVLSMANMNASSSATGDVTTVSEIQMPLVQGVLELEGRRYVVVPKQSVLSVSPNANAVFENHTTLCKRTTNTLARCGSPIGPSSVANTLLVNPSDVNNAGVVLVPVGPSKNTANAYSPQSMARYSAAEYANYAHHHNRLKFPVENTCPSTYAINCNSINGISPNDLSAYHAIGSRAPIEYHSSFNLSNISRIYDPLLMSLKYLTVRDLLRISMTSKFLNRIASEPCLWKTVRLKNSQVHDWKGFAKSLQKYGTKRLDMRKMLCSAVPEDLSKMWQEFLQVIPTITSLEHIDFSRTPMHVIDAVAATCPNLAVFNAMYLKNGSLTFDNFTRLEHLAELRLKGAGGIELIRNDSLLQFVNKDNLREICLTCIKNIDIDLLKMISEASNLVTLELGDCSDLPPSFGTEIGKLQKLEKLRLEKVDNLAPDYELLTILNGMETLKSLELINVEVKDGFDEVMARCNNIENFLIIPLYISQSATTNQLILDGIKGLSDTLKCFVWGLTTELLKVTDLFMDQWQLKSGGGSNNTGSNKKSAGSIPVRKSVDKPSPDGDVPPTHVDILPIPKLERILGTHLPKSRIKVIKVPFQMTWRQSLSDCLK
ncbi:uncharacterized protein LOC135834709 isoform X1 [Planococcus citri]|uniref:uncharacterized protein LOC135834709 isoform X1 n=1 Tax=Planococcus citri TaxID=170843 RepID=UPI0031F736F3